MSAAKKAAKALPAGLRRELDRQQTAVYEAQAVAICVMKAMEAHFPDWPRTVPLFNYALRRVVVQLETVAKALYSEELIAAAALPDVSDVDGN
jgi:hypothetical protein